jgi:hypothetical protein
VSRIVVRITYLKSTLTVTSVTAGFSIPACTKFAIVWRCATTSGGVQLASLNSTYLVFFAAWDRVDALWLAYNIDTCTYCTLPLQAIVYMTRVRTHYHVPEKSEAHYV